MIRRMMGHESMKYHHKGVHDETPACSYDPPCAVVAEIIEGPQNLGPGDSTPSHYQGNGMTPFDVWDAFDLDRYEANAVKYLLRWRKKNGVEDLQKARHYIDIIIKRAQEGKT